MSPFTARGEERTESGFYFTSGAEPDRLMNTHPSKGVGVRCNTHVKGKETRAGMERGTTILRDLVADLRCLLLTPPCHTLCFPAEL